MFIKFIINHCKAYLNSCPLILFLNRLATHPYLYLDHFNDNIIITLCIVYKINVSIKYVDK